MSILKFKQSHIQMLFFNLNHSEKRIIIYTLLFSFKRVV